MSLESKLQETSQDFQKLQVDLAHAVEARQQLDAQLSENEQVKKVQLSFVDTIEKLDDGCQEFAQLKAENTVYKSIGPVLVRQDQAEAKSNVDTRIQFIRGEMWELTSYDEK